MFKKRLGKKGDWEIWLIILQPVIIMVFLAAFGLWIYNLSQDNALEQIYYSRDIPLSVNSVYAAPADYHFTYFGGSVEDFNYLFEDQIVQVGLEGGGEKYYYADDLFYRELFSGLAVSLSPAGNYLEIDSNGLGLGVNEVRKFNQKLKHGYLRTKDDLWTDKTIALKGDDFPVIQFWIEENPGNPPYFDAETVAESDVYLEFKKNKGKGLVAYIDFTTAEKSRKLASILINKILVNNQEVGEVNIYFTDIPNVKEAGVILEIGEELQILVNDIQESLDYFYGGSNE